MMKAIRGCTAWMVGFCIVAITAAADVKPVSAPPEIDGRIDEAAWASADWEGGFRRFRGKKDRKPTVETEFAILADSESLYVGVRARHGRMDELKARGQDAIWSAEAIELYFAPDGNTFDFYQFLLTFQGLKHAIFYSENGNIRPDPYDPDWDYKVVETPEGWTCEARIPLSAFYMTRDSAWKETWKMNVGRCYRDRVGADRSCWIDGNGYRDLGKFRTMRGFPIRRSEEDVWVRSAEPTVKGPKDGGFAGTVKLGIYAEMPGDVTVETSFSKPVRTKLSRRAVREVEVPVLFPGCGRLPMEIRVVRPNCSCVRRYPVVVDYQALRVSFAKPSYRSNFYPGQDSDRVAGTVESSTEGAVSVTLEGPGFGLRSATLAAGGGMFSFDTRGFQVGDATLTVTSGSDTLIRKVRKLAPLGEGRHVSWIENGNLVVDGKPVLRRNMYAQYYMGGEAFQKKYDADDLHMTKWLHAIATLEPDRLIKGLGATEAIRDVKPSTELYAKLDKCIEKGLKTSDGSYYYISDEPECRNISPVYLKYVYDYVSEKDPYHAILTCSRAGERYLDCADWFETHPYINVHYDENGKRVYRRQFNELGDFISAFHPERHPDKCVGGTATCFSSSSCTYPTFTEYIANAWCEFLRGAKTLYPYAYHDLGDRASLYEGTRYLFSSAEALSEVLLEGRRETLVRTPEYEAALWTMPDGEKMFCVQNFTTEPLQAKVPGLVGAFTEFRGTRKFDIPLSTSACDLDLAPLESLVATTKRRDEGLPTFAATQAKIDAAEAERLGRDNQLLFAGPELPGRRPEIDIVTSTRKDGKRKMFDGVRDVIAWSAFGGKDTFYEMSFPESVPEFSEIVVWGLGIGGMTVRIREGGEWQTLEPMKVETGDYSLRYVFGRKHSTVKLRLGFPQKGRVELYEIELPGKGRNAAVKTASTPLLQKRTTDFWARTVPSGAKGHQDFKVLRERGQRYLSFDFRPPARIAERKYTAWSLRLWKTGGHLAGNVTTPIPGLYTLLLPDYDGEPVKDVLALYNYNLALEMGDIICSREPPVNRVEFVESNGLWTVCVTLEKPCEDMTCKIMMDKGRGPVAFSADGQTSFELRPVDSVRAVWTAAMPIPKSALVRDEKGNLPHPFVRVSVLGGSIDRPLLTWLYRRPWMVSARDSAA